MSNYKSANELTRHQNSKPRKRRRRGVVLTITGLEKLKEAQLKLEEEDNWGAKYTYEKLSEIGDLDINTVKKILAAKEGVDRRSLENYFRAFELQLALEDYEKPNPNKRQDWGEAVCVEDFTGRTVELNTLENLLLKNQCRLVTILGMGGVGKTTLSIKLAQKVQERFDCVIWRSFRDAPTLNEFLANSIQFLSNQQITEADLPPSTTKRISYLIDRLRSQRCLIVLDNVESLLCSNSKAGSYREGYEEYGELFRRIGETDHQSCLLLTSREKPKEVAMLEGEALPVCSFRLGGLGQKTGAEILRKKGLNSSEVELNELIRYYNGNSLALKIAATTIGDLFEGDIKEFLREEKVVFGDIRTLLDQQLERLTSLEQEIICWLAINREPVTLSQLREDITLTVSRLNLIEGLESLSRRSLVEQNEACFTLQSVVMEYVLCRLIERVCREIDSQNISFLRRYALIKATAKDYIRETQIRLILQPIIERLVENFQHQKNLEQRLKQILATQQETSPRERGYTAGNIINLLHQMEIDLTGYDFSNLCVWQANLKNARLHHVNFQNSDLSKSVFAENFGGIWSVAFSPNGQYLAAGDTKGDILLRRVADGQIIRSFKGHNGWVVSLAFSPDGKILASSSCDCTAKLWDVDTGQCLHTLREHEHEVWSVAFSPDGKTLASGCDDNKVRLWQVSTGKCLRIFQDHTDYVLSVVFNLDGTKILTGSHDNTIRLWDIECGKCKKIFQGHDDGVRSLAINPDGRTFASSSNDRTVRLWDIETGECCQVFQGHCNGVWSVTFCPQGNFIASGSIDQTVRLWDIETGVCCQVFQGHYNWINSVAFSPQGNFLASGSYDQTVRFWNIDTYQCIKTFQGYSNQALSVVFSPDVQILASGGHDTKIRLWDVKTGEVLKTFQEHNNWVWSVAFSSQGNFLASGSGDKTIKLWDVKTDKVIKTFLGHKAVVRSVIFSSDNQILASASEDKTVRLWNINTGQTIKILQGHQAEIWSIAFSPDGKKLASGSLDGTAKLWDVNTGKCLKTLDEHTSWVWSVAFSPDNQTLATTSPDQTLRLWNINTGECKSILKGDRGCSLLVAFSSDGQVIASCNQDHKIRLWNSDTKKCFGILPAHQALINSIAFGSDNHILVSSSEDETIKIWNIESGECIKTLIAKKTYENMNVMGVSGLSKANIDTIKTIGAVSR